MVALSALLLADQKSAIKKTERSVIQKTSAYVKRNKQTKQIHLHAVSTADRVQTYDVWNSGSIPGQIYNKGL